MNANYHFLFFLIPGFLICDIYCQPILMYFIIPWNLFRCLIPLLPLQRTLFESINCIPVSTDYPLPQSAVECSGNSWTIAFPLMVAFVCYTISHAAVYYYLHYRLVLAFILCCSLLPYYRAIDFVPLLFPLVDFFFWQRY